MLFLGPRKNRIKRNPHYGRYLKKHLKIFRKTALLRGLYTHQVNFMPSNQNRTSERTALDETALDEGLLQDDTMNQVLGNFSIYRGFRVCQIARSVKVHAMTPQPHSFGPKDFIVQSIRGETDQNGLSLKNPRRSKAIHLYFLGGSIDLIKSSQKNFEVWGPPPLGSPGPPNCLIQGIWGSR